MTKNEIKKLLYNIFNSKFKTKTNCGANIYKNSTVTVYVHDEFLNIYITNKTDIDNVKWKLNWSKYGYIVESNKRFIKFYLLDSLKNIDI